MRLNADFAERVVIRPDDYAWARSPAPGVERMMLDRIGDEVARATSLVRYAPESAFPPHVHGGGEEFLVLRGEFGDEHRTYAEGTYVRNPIGTEHSPRVGASGCTIFVKLHQFDADDRRQVVIDTARADWMPGATAGHRVLPLHEYGRERVRLERLLADTRLPEAAADGGEEVLVLEGRLCDELGEYPAGTWLRNPDGSRHSRFTRGEAAIVYVKTGHLPR